MHTGNQVRINLGQVRGHLVIHKSKFFNETEKF